MRISKSASKLLDFLCLDSDSPHNMTLPSEEFGTGKFVFNLSPTEMCSPDISVQITPPTFRGFENAPQSLIRDSLTDMKSKLASLHDNKSALAAKMEEFERKLRETESEDVTEELIDEIYDI
jgi:hypothetical protein